MDHTSSATPTAGPAFSQARVVHFSSLSQEEKDQFVRFFSEQKVQFFKDADGSFVANVRLFDPNVIDMTASNGGKPKKDDRKASKRAADEEAKGGADAGSPGLDYGVYARFTALIAPRDGVKPKARPLAWMMRLIEEIYDQRYAKDTADLRGEAEGDGGGGESGSTPFPQFVVDFFSKRYGLRSLIDQTCWDLLYNLHTLRREHLEVETFARFLEAHYDPDDLLFYLYVRSVIQKELNVSFRTRWSELGRAAADGAAANTGAPAPLHLSVRECALVSRVVFGSEGDPLYRTFLAMIERHLTGTRRGGPRGADGRRIDVTQFLHLALVEYHETRPADDDGGSRGRGGGDDDNAAPSSVSGGGGGGLFASDAAASSSHRAAAAAALGGYPFDDLAAAGLGAHGGGAGAGAGCFSPAAADRQRLVHEAEAAYDAARHASPPPPPPPPHQAASPAQAAGSPGSRAAALLRRSPQFFDELGEGMHAANEAFLDRALASAAAAALPLEVQAQIRAEVQAQLEAKLDVILASTIKATQSGAATGSAARDALVAHFLRVMAAAAGEAGPGSGAAAGADATIPAFCGAVLRQPEVLETVGPLVALLVSYATSRLQEAAAGGGDA